MYGNIDIKMNELVKQFNLQYITSLAGVYNTFTLPWNRQLWLYTENRYNERGVCIIN